MRRFCTSCGAARDGDAPFCADCGQAFAPQPLTTQAPGPAPAAAAAPAAPRQTPLQQTRQQISDWVTSVNTVALFCTATLGLLLDFLAPLGPWLAVFAAVMGLLWLLALAARTLPPQKAARLGRAVAWLGTAWIGHTAPVWRNRQLWTTGALLTALVAFATVSQQARSEGGALASHSNSVKSWQEAAGLVSTQLGQIQAAQQTSNELLRQGNDGQQTQTRVLTEIRDTLQGVPQNRAGLKATLWTEEIQEARRLLDAGLTTTLQDAYQLATMTRPRSVALLLERPASVERTDGDCAAVLDPAMQTAFNGRVVRNAIQTQVIEAFCGSHAQGPSVRAQLGARIQEIETQVSAAQTTDRFRQCAGHYQARRKEYQEEFARSKRFGYASSRCGFESCRTKDLLEFHSGDTDAFADVVRQQCLETAAPELEPLNRELSGLRAQLAELGR